MTTRETILNSVGIICATLAFCVLIVTCRGCVEHNNAVRHETIQKAIDDDGSVVVLPGLR